MYKKIEAKITRLTSLIKKVYTCQIITICDIIISRAKWSEQDLFLKSRAFHASIANQGRYPDQDLTVVLWCPLYTCWLKMMLSVPKQTNSNEITLFLILRDLNLGPLAFQAGSQPMQHPCQGRFSDQNIVLVKLIPFEFTCWWKCSRWQHNPVRRYIRA